MIALKLKSFFSLLLVGASAFAGPPVLDLSGKWGFRLDPSDVGVEEQWHEDEFAESLRLPGCLQEQGYGNVPGPNTIWWDGKPLKPYPWALEYHREGDFKIQSFLLPDRHYIGAAWYVREIEIPNSWEDKIVELFLERCHWESRLWLDGEVVGVRESLAVPHEYRLGRLRPGRHRLVLRVDNSAIHDLGPNAHSVSEQTAGTWNGVVGKIELRAHDSVWIKRTRVLPRVEKGVLQVRVRAGNATGVPQRVSLRLDAAGIGDHAHDPEALTWSGELSAEPEGELVVDYPMGGPVRRWDEFSPNRYQLHVDLECTVGSSSSRIDFGIRDFAVDGRQFTIHGQKTFLRGNTDCALMPKTGYAPMDVESWRKVWRTYKDFGLNTARFHSWCPPEAAFVAADEIGIYLAPEVGEWTHVGPRKKELQQFLREESLRILETYGHHPSFVMMGLGNEFGGQKDFFAELIETWKAADPSRVYTIKANSPANPPNVDFVAARTVGGKQGPGLRYQGGWPPMPEGSLFNTRPPQTVIDWREAVQLAELPVVQHETAQICAYPDVMRERSKYTGYLKASYLDIAEDQLSRRGMLEQVPDFVEASGRWQMEVTREEFEAAYRTPGLAGFHWLGLIDFTGQTTAPVGLCDAFYDPKPYVDPAEVRRWNGPTVLLARMEKRILTQEDRFSAGIEVAHHRPRALALDDLVATLLAADGTPLQHWELPPTQLGQGNGQRVGEIETPLKDIEAPARLTLRVESATQGLSNEWDLWVYPADQPAPFPEGVEVVRKWNAATRALLDEGKSVLLLPDPETLNGKLPMCFTPYYWTSFGTLGGQSSACGILLDPEHPLFRHFPTEGHADWQWWDLLTRSRPMILHGHDSKHPFPKAYRPLVQAIDSWKINRKLGLVIEARVGKGRLMVCSIDLEKDLEQRPATRQFRKSLCAYLQSSDFEPETNLDASMIEEIFGDAEATHGDGSNLPTDG
jgi:hypothetical protein